MPSGLFYRKSLDKSIFYIRGRCLGSFYYCYYCFVEISEFNANRADPDQMPHSAASDLGLHCLSVGLKGLRINKVLFRVSENVWILKFKNYKKDHLYSTYNYIHTAHILDKWHQAERGYKHASHAVWLNISYGTVSVLKFHTMQTVQSQIRLLWVYIVCHSTKYFVKQIHK